MIFFHFLRVWKYNTDLSPERFFLNCVKWPFSCTIQNTQHCQVISAEPNLNKFPLLAKGNSDDFWLHFALQCSLLTFLGFLGLQAPLIKCLHHHHPHLHHLYYCLPWRHHDNIRYALLKSRPRAFNLFWWNASPMSGLSYFTLFPRSVAFFFSGPRGPLIEPSIPVPSVRPSTRPAPIFPEFIDEL